MFNGLPFFAVCAIERQSGKHEDRADPLQRRHRMLEYENGCEDREEFPSRRYYAARQGAEVCDCHEDEILQK